MEDIIVQLRLKYIEDLEDILQCPVCWEMPTRIMVFSCTKGHHICERCKNNYPLFTCPVCESQFNGSRNYIAEEISEKFEDIKSSLLEPNHYTNRRVEKRCVSTQTEEVSVNSAETQTVAGTTQDTRETQCDPDSNNNDENDQRLESEQSMDLDDSSMFSDNQDSEKENTAGTSRSCIIKTCEHTCFKNDMVSHIEKEHKNLTEISTLENDFFIKSWKSSYGDKSTDFILNITDIGIIHLNIKIDKKGCLHGKIQAIQNNYTEVRLRYVLSLKNTQNFGIYEPFKGTVQSLETEELETEKIFLASQIMKKFLVQKDSTYEIQLILYSIPKTD